MPALLVSAPLLQGSSAAQDIVPQGDTPAPTVAVPAGVLPLQAGCGKAPVPWPMPLGYGWAVPHRPWCSVSSHGVSVHSSCTGLLTGKAVPVGRALPAGTLRGGRCRQRRGRELAGSPRTGAGGSLQSQQGYGVRCRMAQPGEPLFSSGLWEFPPLPRPPPTLHAGEVPSFLWQRSPTQFAALLSLALARALPARPQLPPSR